MTELTPSTTPALLLEPDAQVPANTPPGTRVFEKTD